MIDKNNIIEKSNKLNEIHIEDMELTELRLFLTYLSKINAREPDKREIIIKLKDFEELFGIDKVNVTQLHKMTKKIQARSVSIYSNENEFDDYNLYSRFRYNAESRELLITCNNDIMPFIFEMKNQYTTYKLLNIINLKSKNQIRMYEILKQHESIGTVTFDLIELKEKIGIRQEQYNRYTNFKDRVLEPCKQAINQNTDIMYDYNAIKQGKAGKVVAVEFIIKGKKKKSKEISMSKTKEKDIQKSSASNINDCFTELYEHYFKDRNFKKSDTETIIIKLTEKVNSSGAKVKQLEEVEIYLKNLMAAYDKQRGNKTLENKVGYILGMIDKSAFIKQKPEYRQREEQSYDINEFEKYAINYEELKKVEEQSEDVQHNSDAEEMTISEKNFKAETLEQFFERVGYKSQL